MTRRDFLKLMGAVAGGIAIDSTPIYVGSSPDQIDFVFDRPESWLEQPVITKDDRVINYIELELEPVWRKERMFYLDGFDDSLSAIRSFHHENQATWVVQTVQVSDGAFITERFRFTAGADCFGDYEDCVAFVQQHLTPENRIEYSYERRI